MTYRPAESAPPVPVLELLDIRLQHIVLIKDVPLGNANWLLESAQGKRRVLRRYAAWVTKEELEYEHAVLAHLAAVGWTVPEPLSELISWEDRWYCLTRYVPGQAVAGESIGQQARRGRDLARLHLSLRGLNQRLSQRRGWRPQHRGVTVWTEDDLEPRVRGLAVVSPRLAMWAQAAATQTREELAALGASDLPLLVVHGDFAEWNVHYENNRLSGVIDFALTHVDSRPYELAVARAYRAPELLAAYRTELAVAGWPLSDLEEAAIAPVYRAFRLGMVAVEMADGLSTGNYNLPAIERQLARTGTPAP